jgi:hypothetical protein
VATADESIQALIVFIVRRPTSDIMA